VIFYLVDTNDKLDLVTSAAGDVDVSAFYADMNSSFAVSGLGKQLTTITTATTTDVLAAPGASTTRLAKSITIRNTHATVANDVTLRLNDNATVYELDKVTLQPGDERIFIEGSPPFTVTNISSGRLLTNIEGSTSQSVFFSQLERAAVGTFLTIGGTAYCVYVGRVAQAITAAFVEFHVTTVGAGAQTAEVGLFSTPTAPSKSNQTLTKIVATGTVDSLTSTGAKRNTSNFAQVVQAGTHLWAVYRVDMATTEPTCGGIAGDMSQGHILTLVGASALTGISTIAGVIPAIATATVAPDLRVTLS
jgi:plastocyanin